MTEIIGIDWSPVVDIILSLGILAVSAILFIFAFFYLRANRDFDLSLKSLGTQEDIAKLNRQLLIKKDEIKRLEKQEMALQDRVNDLQTKRATIDQVTGELDTLGLKYESKRKELAQLERDLVKNQALKDFVEEHQKEQLDSIESMIAEKQARLNELQSQITELNGTHALNKALETAFNEINEQLDQNLRTVSNELTSLSEIQASKAALEQTNAQLEQNRKDLNEQIAVLDEQKASLTSEIEQQSVESKVGQSLGQVFDNLTDTLNEQVTQGLEAMGDQISQLQQVNSAKDKLEQAKEQLEQEIEDLQDQLDNLEQQSKDKTKELEDLEHKVYNHKVEEQVGQSLNEAFERLSQSINSSMENVGADLSNVMGLQAQCTMLEDKLKDLNHKLAQANKKLAGTAKDGDEKKLAEKKAYEDLEQEPKGISKFLDDSANKRATNIDEGEALTQFQRYLRSQDLYYPTRVINAFHTALKIQKINPLSVLAGVSGTGKTQLALRYADFFGFYPEHVAVQPRWDSKDDLLGFYNFLEQKFQPTDLVRALWHFNKYHPEDHPQKINPNSPMMMVILDEMNLARVEYYFSEFLSKLELRGSADYPKSEITIGSNLYPRRFFVGSNVVIVGTMNDDESTYALSDKVLDRANVQHFGKPGDHKPAASDEKVKTLNINFERFNQWCQHDNIALLKDQELEQQLQDHINQLNSALDKVGKPFGHRVHKAIEAYIKAYPLSGGIEPTTAINRALADQIEMKIIPKLAGLEFNENSTQCLNLLSAVIESTTPNDDPLRKAFNSAHDEYRNNNMFIWRGVTRNLDE